MSMQYAYAHYSLKMIIETSHSSIVNLFHMTFGIQSLQANLGKQQAIYQNVETVQN